MSRNDLSGVTPLSHTISSDDLLGKEVFDIAGASAGIIDIVHIDPQKLEFVGISIDEGFLKRGIIVGKEYIERIGSRAVFLNIRPVFATRGMHVFDVEGREIGKVRNVTLVQNKNIIESLQISQGLFKHITIPGSYIKRIGENIFLSVSREALQKSVEPKQSGRAQ